MSLKNSGITFHYKAKENGECEMLEDNKCKLYDNENVIMFKVVI